MSGARNEYCESVVLTGDDTVISQAELDRLRAELDALKDSHCDCCTGERKAEAAIARVRELCGPAVNPRYHAVHPTEILRALDGE